MPKNPGTTGISFVDYPYNSVVHIKNWTPAHTTDYSILDFYLSYTVRSRLRNYS